MTPILATLKALWGSRRAVAAVEFALIAPILVALLGGAVDLGRAVERGIKLENAARAGAQWLQMNALNNSFGDVTSLNLASYLTTTVNEITGLGATATVSDAVCGCVNSAGNGFLDADGTAITTLTTGLCTATCQYGLAKFRTVTIRLTFTRWLPTSNFIPFNNLGAQERTVTVRI